MGRKQVKPKTKQKKQDGVPEHLATNTRLAIGLSIAGAVAAILCVLVFFQSDIRTKIIVAKAAEFQQTAQPAIGSTADADGVDAPVTGAAGSSGADGKDGQDGAPGASQPIVIAPGAIIDREALAEHLRDMAPADFTALAESVDMLIANDPAMVNLPERKSLAEAYAEAESKYPGQIDGSKRLKLVDELNAIDYMYYVAEDGDTLLQLSKSFGVPLGQLVEINGIPEADKIKAGAILLLPSETVQPE